MPAGQKLIACMTCGTQEHPHLIDGKSPTGDENADFTLLQCIACYGEGWCPTVGVEDIALSVAPHLKPLYERYAQRKLGQS